MRILYLKNGISVVTLVTALSFYATGGFAQPIPTSSSASTFNPVYGEVIPTCDCEDLTKVTIPNTTIESAVVDPKNGSCQVTAVVNHPPANDRVKVWIALPLKNWNGRFYGTGGGGFMGGNAGRLSEPVAKGFAAGATDTGHDGGSGAFALDTVNHRLNWQSIRDNAYLGIHDMTVVGRAFVQVFYGKPARYSYFVGASTGGKQGLMEAQRFPEDYDGIVSMCPAINWSRFLIADLWPQAVMFDAKNYVSKEKLDAVTKAVISASDGADGVVDGVIDDPLHCTWDPKVFVGTAVGESKFTEADADVVRKIWEGPRAKDGSFLWYGLTRGANPSALAGTKGNPLTGAPFSIALDWFRYFLLLDPKWDGTSLTCDELELLWNQSVDQYTEVFNADNPDLTRFRDHGGKLIIMHGLADQLIFPQGTIDYFERVQSRMGGTETTSKFARLFLVPAVDHGFRGAGPGPVGQFDALFRWVEEGKAPDLIMAELRDKSGDIVMTRPLFPYPQIARYSGSGSTNDAANFLKSLPAH